MADNFKLSPSNAPVTGLKEGDVKQVDALQYENNVKKGYIPEGYDSVEDYLKDVRETYEKDYTADYENRLEAIEDKKFAIGDQWDPRVLEHRAGLPCLVINTIPQFTAQLVGDWRQSRNAVKVLPSEDGDEDIAEIRGDLIRSIEYKSRADRVYDSAFESVVTCGDGAFRIAVEYARDDVFDQDIFIRPIEDALSVIWDRMSVDPTGKDARHCFVEDTIPKEEFLRKWPGKDPSELGQKMQITLRRSGWYDSNTFRVVEHWRMIERDRLLCLFEDGSIHVVDKGTLEDVVAKHGMPTKTRIAPCMYAQMHLVTGWGILSGPYEYKLSRLPIIRMVGRSMNIEGIRFRYGLVRFMKDSARLRNFWRSVAAEQLGYAPKSQWIAPHSAVAGREQAFRKAHLTRDPLLIYNDDAVTPPQRLEPPAPQMALLNEAQVNTQDMKDVTGIHDASLGIKSNEVSGRAIQARQHEGDIASLTFYDNGNAAILEGGDVINQLISQIYDGTRIVRTIGNDEVPKLVKINDPMDPNSPNLAMGGYDVALSTGPSYSTKREAAAQSMMDAVQVWPQLLQVAGDLVAKAQNWDGAQEIAERLQKTLPPQFLSPEERQKQQQEGGGQPPIDPAMVQQAMQKMQELEEENEKLKAKNDIEWYNAVTQRIRALSDNQVDGNQMEQQALQTILSHIGAEQDKQHEMTMAEMAHQQAMEQQEAAAQQQGQQVDPDQDNEQE